MNPEAKKTAVGSGQEGDSEFRSCVKVEVAVLGSPVPNSPYGLCGRKATLNVNWTGEKGDKKGRRTPSKTDEDCGREGGPVICLHTQLVSRPALTAKSTGTERSKTLHLPGLNTGRNESSGEAVMDERLASTHLF